MYKTEDILQIFKEKYKNGEFRVIGNNVQQSKTIEIQDAHFIADKAWIIREPNYEYFERELKWYLSQSLNVNDIPGGAPTMWKACADKDGFINSNYGWVIFSDDNGDQYNSCKKKLLEDNHTREAVMIYDRPSMQTDYNKNGMHDFMCTQYVQYFINERDGEEFLDCIVNIRSNDAVFGYDNDWLWFDWVLDKLSDDLRFYTGRKINKGLIHWNAGSLHVYERHFKFLEDA
jgi:thymidylate synthase